MFQKQHTYIFNSNMPWFALFCSLGILYLSINVSVWCLLFLLILPFSFRKIKPNALQILLIISILIGFGSMAIFNSQFKAITYVNEFIKVITRNKLSNAIINFINNKYSKEISSFIKLILFNIKSKDTYTFYNQVVDLGIVWLFCVSGFHIALITRIIKRICKNRARVGLCINLAFVSLYLVFLKIPYGCLRIWLSLFYTHVFKKIKLHSFEKLGFIGLNICMLNPCCFANYGFLLSFIVCMGANYLNKFEIQNKLINQIVGCVVFYLLTIPFIFDMSKKVSLFTFINTFVFTYLLTGYFIYFLLFSWLAFMTPVHLFLIKSIYLIVGNIALTNIFIYSNKWEPWIKFIYYSVFIGLFKLSYLIVYNNKI